MDGTSGVGVADTTDTGTEELSTVGVVGTSETDKMSDVSDA